MNVQDLPEFWANCEAKEMIKKRLNALKATPKWGSNPRFALYLKMRKQLHEVCEEIIKEFQELKNENNGNEND